MESGCCRRTLLPETFLSTRLKYCVPHHSICTCPSRSCGLDNSAPSRGLSNCWNTAFGICLRQPTQGSQQPGAERLHPRVGGRRDRASSVLRQISIVL